MSKPTLKEMLFNLMTHYEHQFREKTAMQAILDGCRDANTRKTWRSDVEVLVNDPETAKAAHAVFEPIYAQIREARDEADVIELLSRFPTKGKPN